MLVFPVIIYMISIKNIFLVSSESYQIYFLGSVKPELQSKHIPTPTSFLENGRGGPSLSMGKGLIPTQLMVQDPENSMELSSASPHYTCKSLISLIYSQVHLIVYMSID